MPHSSTVTRRGMFMTSADRYRRTELHYAANAGDVAAVRSLLAAGSDPDARDSQGWSPLHFAAQAASGPVVQALIDAGASIGVRDSHGNTALFRAVFSYRGDGTAILALLAARADPHVRNESGVSPYSLAHTIANTDVARYFPDAGAI